MQLMILKKAILYLTIFILGLTAVALLNVWQVLHPQKIYVNDDPKNYGLKPQNLTLTTSDGLKLSAWYIESVKNKAVILLHGYPAEKSDLLPTAFALSRDFSILLIDFRYLGQSEGKISTLGLKEVLDVKAGLDFLETRGFEQIGVYGFSLGGAVALMTASQDDRVSAIVTQSAFADLVLLGQDLYKNLFVLNKPLIWLMTAFSKILFKVSPAQISPQTAASNLKIPVLVMHSKQDEQIPFHHAEKLAQTLSHNPLAEFYFFDSGRHGELPLDLDQRIKTFFLDHLDR